MKRYTPDHKVFIETVGGFFLTFTIVMAIAVAIL